MKTYYSNGKLLITGEYGVLDGALSFALPTKFGQNLKVTETNNSLLKWTSFDHLNKEWLSITLDLNKLSKGTRSIIETSDTEKAITLLDILNTAKKANPAFLTKGADVITQLSFPNNWGLGTSSTLINNIASWAQIDAFELLWNSFKGSGYDIACAQNNTPITYQITQNKPAVNPISFSPNFTDDLFFIHLNKKQNSKEGIAHYRKLGNKKKTLVKELSSITEEIIKASSLEAFESLVNTHEDILSKHLEQPKVKDLYFSDYNGSVKSLGAWGGDFILATGNKKSMGYFEQKGYTTILSYNEMILV
ncbi:GYDIA family GHMP kinase [Neptunitalea lumnitzerae]|uniref:Mevalonate kinase n=1 Tax=Neptunitalea lumnitzerae TaxID=2965509 RepID=A0ABQ5MGY8_9FLAO|nr:GYDIA family GHMP kinase [Neptunitalea sp. Y10]GLB48683.1 hypothetical protein Y10_10510 [Neptunitalea sp. Y10]